MKTPTLYKLVSLALVEQSTCEDITQTDTLEGIDVEYIDAIDLSGLLPDTEHLSFKVTW